MIKKRKKKKDKEWRMENKRQGGRVKRFSESQREERTGSEVDEDIISTIFLNALIETSADLFETPVHNACLLAGHSDEASGIVQQSLSQCRSDASELCGGLDRFVCLSVDLAHEAEGHLLHLSLCREVCSVQIHCQQRRLWSHLLIHINIFLSVSYSLVFF